MNASSTWVEVSSALTTVDSHHREMTSSTATTHRPAAAVKWVKSYADVRTMPTAAVMGRVSGTAEGRRVGIVAS
ncbi:hypothetical protein [uncultured Serinicoccus sp.]|uniref:hypothetical protein n=1 Tax=uncultured Serinicoccus sp. TaxID=735514 RepID=UPI00263019FA|nr:hypothetical protein [uncultured Serinicoccus sp.]